MYTLFIRLKRDITNITVNQPLIPEPFTVEEFERHTQVFSDSAYTERLLISVSVDRYYDNLIDAFPTLNDLFFSHRIESVKFLKIPSAEHAAFQVTEFKE